MKRTDELMADLLRYNEKPFTAKQLKMIKESYPYMLAQMADSIDDLMGTILQELPSWLKKFLKKAKEQQ